MFAFNADIQTAGTNQYLWLDNLITAAPVGTKMWIVADLDGNGINTDVTANGLIQADDFLLFETFVDGTLIFNNPGRYRFLNLSVEDSFLTASIYVYLWNTNTAAENGGDQFGILNLGAVAPPPIGNAQWTISNNIIASTYTLRGYTTNLWNAPSSGLWSSGASWNAAPSAGGTSDTLLVFSGTTPYFSTNDLTGDFLLNILRFTNSAAKTLSGNTLKFTNQYGVPLIQQLGGGQAIVENPLLLGSDLRLEGNGSGTTILAGQISGPGGWRKEGSSTFVLGNANTYAGTSVIAGGIIQLGHNSALSTNRVVFTNGTLASADGSTRTIANALTLGDVTFGGSGDLIFTGPADLNTPFGQRALQIDNALTEFQGVLSNGGIVKAGAGTLMLSGNNTFTNGLYITEGAVRVASLGALNSALPAVVSIDAGTLELNGVSISIGGLFGYGGTVINGGSTPADLTLNSDFDGFFYGSLDDGGLGSLKLIKAGAGTEIFEADNTYSGGTEIRGGAIQINTLNGLGSGPVSVGNGTLIVRHNFDANIGLGNGYDVIITNNATINIGNASGDPFNIERTLALGSLAIGTNTLTIVSPNTFFLGVNGGAEFTNSTIETIGGGLIVRSNALLSGTNTFSGNERIFLGGQTNRFASNSALNVSTSRGMAISNLVVLTATNLFDVSSKLFLDAQITNGAFPGRLVKNGAGELYLTNLSQSGYSGGTVLNEGTLIAASGTNPTAGTFITQPLGTGPVTINGGTLLLRSDSAAVTNGAGNGYAILMTADATIAVEKFATNSGGTIYVSSLNWGNNNLTVAGSNNYTLRINANSRITNTTVQLPSAGVTFAYGGTLAMIGPTNTFNGLGNFRVFGITTSGTNASFVFNSTGSATFAGFQANGTNLFQNEGTVTLGAVSQNISDSHIIKTGSGNLTFSANSSFTGGVEAHSGTIQANSATALGTATNVVLGAATLVLRNNNSTFFGPSGGYTVTLTSNATIDVRRNSGGNTANRHTISNIVFNGRQLTVTGANSFQLGIGATNWTGIDINTLSAPVVFINPSTLSGTNRFAGTGTANLVRFDGPTLFTANSLIDASVAGGLVITDPSINGTLTISNAANVLLNGVVSDGLSTGSIVKQGSGTLFLTNMVSATLSGGINLAEGAVQTASDGTVVNPLGAGPVVLSGGTLQLRADVDATFGAGAGYTIQIATNSTINVNRITSPITDRTLAIAGITGPGSLTVSGGNGYILAFNDDAVWSNTTITANSLLQYNGTVNVYDTNYVTGLFRSAGGFFLNGPTTFSNAGALTLLGDINDGTSAGVLIKTGGGTLFLTNLQNQTYSGGTVINTGALTASGGTNMVTEQFVTSPLGTGPITMNGGTLNLRADTNVTWGGTGYDITVNGNSTLSLAPLSGNPNNIRNQEFSFGPLSNYANLIISQSSNFTARFLAPAYFSNAVLTANATSVFSTVTLDGFGRIAGNRDTFISGLVDEATVGAVLEKDGTARLYLTNLIDRSYSGGTIIRAGQLRIHTQGSVTAPLGTGADITMHGGTLELRDTSSRTIGSAVNGGNGYNIVAAGTNVTAIIDVNRYTGSSQNGELRLNGLVLTNGASLQVNGGNNYTLRFQGATRLGNVSNNVINVNNSRSSNPFSLRLDGPITAETPGTAKLIKQGGYNDLGYLNSAEPDHGGGTWVLAGDLIWRPTGLASGSYGFGTGAITLDNGATFGFQNNQNNVYTLANDFILNQTLQTASGRANYSGGRLDTLRQANSPATTLSGSVLMGGDLKLNGATGGGYGTNKQALTLTGPITVRSDDLTIFAENDGDGSGERIVIRGPLTSDTGTRRLMIASLNGANLELSGDHTGLGSIFVTRGYSGNQGYVKFVNTVSIPASGVTVAPGAVVSVGQQQFLNGTTPFSSLGSSFNLSHGSIVLIDRTNVNGTATYGGLIDLSATGLNRDIRIGVGESYTTVITGGIVPHASTYKLGGGQGVLQLTGVNQLTGATGLNVGPDPGFDANEIVSIAPLLGGTVILNTNNNYTGGTVINPGSTLDLRHTNGLGSGAVVNYGVLSVRHGGGTLTDDGRVNLNALTLQAGSTLQFENNDALHTNRFGDAESVTLNASTLRLLGRNTGGQFNSELLSNLVVNGGSRIQTDQRSTTGNILLGFTNISRGLGYSGITNGTLQLVANRDGQFGNTNRIIISDTSTLAIDHNNMVAPWIVNQGGHHYLTYDTTQVGGLDNGLINFSGYFTGLAGADTGAVANVSGVANNLTADQDIWALRLNTNTRITNNSGADDKVLTIRSGGVLAAGNATNDAHLVFRDGTGNKVEGLLYVNGTLRLQGTNDGAIITKFGDGTLQLATQQPGYTNGWNVNRGTLNAALNAGSVATAGINNSLGSGDPSNFINLNGSATLSLTSVGTNITYASGKITSWDNNILSANLGNQDDRHQFFAPHGLDLNSISNGPLGSQLRVDLGRTRSALHVVGPLTLNASGLLNIRDTGGASGNTGSTNRLILDGGLVGAGKLLVKIGNGVLELPTDNSGTFTGGEVRINGGALSVGHHGSLGDAATIVNVASNAVLELNAGLASFQPVATVTQQAGSAERWLGTFNRFTDDATSETYLVPTNVTLQIAVNQTGAANANTASKTVRLQGGGLEGWEFTGDSRSTTLTISNHVEFTTDLRLGRSGIDVGRGGVISVFNGSFTEINPGLNLVKVGGDTVRIGGGAMNHTGNTIIQNGEFQIGAANGIRTAGTLDLWQDGRFNLNNFNQTVAGLSGSGMVTNSGTGNPETLTINSTSSHSFSGSIGGILALTKSGTGIQTLAGAGSYTGDTTINGGTLELAADAPLGGTPSIVLNTGGTLLLSGTPGNRINDTAAMNFAGGTFHSGGLNESLGALTLSATSILDFGTGASTVLFTSGTQTSGTLTIENWTGSLTGSGTDQLRFDNPLDNSLLGNINFTGYQAGALQINFGSYVEIVPVPEPATIAAALGLLSLVGWRERRRFASLLRR